MDSTLGKIIAALLVLLAVFAVVVTGAQALSRHNDNALVSGITTLSTHIQGDYANNTAGYGTLSNATVIAAGEVPDDLLKNGQIVNPWGNPITVSPVSGAPHNFQIDVGTVPAATCVNLLVHTPNLAGAVVDSTQLPAPYTSQECVQCGHVHPDNRPTQALFLCQRCGHQDHADANASKVIARRGVDLVRSGQYQDKDRTRTMRLRRKRNTVGEDFSERDPATGQKPAETSVRRQGRNAMAHRSVKQETPAITPPGV